MAPCHKQALRLKRPTLICQIDSVFLLHHFRSKIFIRFPKTLFATEDALETRKHSLGNSLVNKDCLCISCQLLLCSRFGLFFFISASLQLPSYRQDGKATARKPSTKNSEHQVRSHSSPLFTQLAYQPYCNSLHVLVWGICLLLHAAIAVQAWWRGILARRRAQRRRQAANTIRRYKYIRLNQQVALHPDSVIEFCKYY